MNYRKAFNIIILLVFLFSFFGENISITRAQTPAPPVKDKPEKPKKITQADRQAAADRAAADGFTLDTMATADMSMPGVAPRYFSHPNYANSPLPTNIVSQWNAIAQNFLQPTPMAGMAMSPNGISMATAFVYMSYIQAAVYDALVAIEGGYQPYALQATTPEPSASREAAVATAAFSILDHYFPNDPTLMKEYKASLDSILDDAKKTLGVQIGQAAAQAILDMSLDANLLAANTYDPLPADPGIWQPTVLDNGMSVPAIDPWMAILKPFTMSTPDQFRYVVGQPWALDSAEYANELNAVKQFGAIGTTPEQKATAFFWMTNNVIQFNSAYRALAENQGMNLLDTARLMAMGNMVGTDALIACFDSKYTYSYWRPVEAIRRAAEDNNPLTDPDPAWQPLGITPSFPEYVAGHSCYVAAQSQVLTEALGTDQIGVELASLITGSTRVYATAADMRLDVNNARVWAGYHYPGSTSKGETLGLTVAVNALANFFQTDALSDTGQHVTISGGIRKFVDQLSQLCDPAAGPCEGSPTIGQFMPIAVPDTTTYPGSDYYEIALVQYSEKMHSDLPPTLLRGYVQLWTPALADEHLGLGVPVALSNELLDGTLQDTGKLGVTDPHYMGPTIIAQKDRPVRIKFYNLLPTGIDGDLFLPVDTTVMGAGMGADLYGMAEDPLNPMCGMAYDDLGNRVAKLDGCYTENRATLHLHGGISPWISDGTPHQWITPANETTAYPQGVSVKPVPDMGDSGAANDGVMTFYYTNQQSARLMFYHDHAYGITRLNVYAGEAAPYIITDEMERTLLDAGLLPGADSTYPLVIQDKTFVPSSLQLAVSDETWDMGRWGDTGDLWLPHVYSPAQNPGDSSGVNQFGRWAYGPWFWPPTNSIKYGPTPNPYYDADCNPDLQWCEPPLMPGTPYNSMGMEAFMDTPVINGTVYPTLTVDPKSYRFRLLNAANDRFFNLSLYVATDVNGVLCDGTQTVTDSPSGVSCTEAPLNPAEVAAALEDPTIFPTPLAGTEGPDWIQVGTEGGFLSAPAVIPAHPITWVNDPTVFNAGNVDLHSLLIGPAERADVIVDFSAYAGQTLILYNDAPAAFPARDPRYDYYTGNGDYRDTGGAPSTLPGYGPNTRTVMQIIVKPATEVTPAPAYDVAALESAFKSTSLGGLGVFEQSQHPIIVGQGAYNSAYGTSFATNGVYDGFVQIHDTSLTFKTLLDDTLTMSFENKMIQDEMGEAFDPFYGRMSGFLGLETPNAQAGLQNMLLYPFAMPPTEVLRGIELPPGVELSPLTITTDGTQIWKITHNGVDTHPVHFHLFDVQLINRVGWDGIIRPPEANELGWKDTVRVSPLEDTIVALRPLIPQLPAGWDLPNSVRLLDPTMPEGVNLTDMGMVIFDPSGEPVQIYNHYINYGWEYVWHCHILSHEEMDMMRPIVVGITPDSPSGLSYSVVGRNNDTTLVLSWVDESNNETNFIVQRAPTAAGPWMTLDTLPADITSYEIVIGRDATKYHYQVLASNTVGDTATYAAPSIGFPTETMISAPSNLVSYGTVDINAPSAPTGLTAVFQTGPQILLTWNDTATTETGFVIERSTDGVSFSALVTVGPLNKTGSVSFIDTTVLPGFTYTYRVAAVNAGLLSTYSNSASASIPALPAAPTFLTATAVAIRKNATINLTWNNVANETGYVIQRSSNASFTANVVTTNVGANVTTLSVDRLSRFTAYYFRIASVNAAGMSIWVNATPFPIFTP